jgi:hypothetical protein
MDLADEITNLVREHFDQPEVILTPETDIAVVFGGYDAEEFNDFLEKVGKRFGITHRELRDMAPGAETRPPGVVHFLWDLAFRKIDMEVVCVDHLTVAELVEIAKSRRWPERYIMPNSKCREKGEIAKG